MRLGIIARRDNTGLGYQTKAYYKHLNPLKTMVIDLSNLNGNPQNTDWYPGEMVVKGFPNRLQIKHFLNGLDVVLTAETPYNYELYTFAKQAGVRVANVINWEFFDYFVYPERPKPDIIIMPSVWHLREAVDFGKEHGIRVEYIHHPVDLDEITYIKRTRGKPFHIAGKPAAMDRNGTMTFMQAFPDGRLATQSEQLAHQIRKGYRHSNVFTNIDNPNHLYQIGDILVFPRKYGGNCLPLNEALAAGCPVVMPDISPNNYLLPKHWLVPATTTQAFYPRTKVEIYEVSPADLQQRVAEIQNNIEAESERAYKIAQDISWQALKDKFLEVLK